MKTITEESYDDTDLRLELLTPFGWKMITEGAKKYRAAYKSYKFGVKEQIMAKWLWIVIVVIALVSVIALYSSGALDGVIGR